MATIEQLNSEHEIPAALRFIPGNGGLVKAVISTPQAMAEIYLHGAHVTHYQPAGQEPVLFLSGKSRFETGKAIRGGVPICLPWFGSLEGVPGAPAHGFARTSEWTVAGARQNAHGSVAIELKFSCFDDPGNGWLHPFSASYVVTVGATLRLELAVRAEGKEPFQFEEALHSYFHVADVKQVSVTGLSGTEYLDKLQANRKITEGSDPMHIVGETDRIYLNTTATCEITDPVLNRKIIVSKTGSHATVLWNPWIAKAKAMADFGDDEWPGMLCIETCNVGPMAVKLKPGQSHVMTAEIRHGEMHS